MSAGAQRTEEDRQLVCGNAPGTLHVRAVKRILIIFLAYAGLVAVFESVFGYFQPETGKTLTLTTTASDGTASDRVLARLVSSGHLYVSAHHWPRAWYNRALQNPKVQVTMDGEKGDYLAVPVTGEEHDRVDEDNRTVIHFRVLMGFAPRSILRLDRR